MNDDIYAKTCEGAIEMYDQAFRAERLEDVYAIMTKGDGSYYIEVLKIDIDRMGLDIFKRKQNIFIGKYSEDGLDGQQIHLTRKATMHDGLKCRETFITNKTDKGWQIVKREKIEIEKPLFINDSNVVFTYETYGGWTRGLFVPWLQDGVEISMVADRIADERGPTKNQLRVLEEIIKYENHDVIHDIAEKTFCFVKEVLENWLGDWEDLSDDELRECLGFSFVKPANAMQSLLTIRPPFRIYISEDVDPDKEIIFHFDVENICEMEHGLSFLFKNWEIVEYGIHGGF